jgi:hypothetical protein
VRGYGRSGTIAAQSADKAKLTAHDSETSPPLRVRHRVLEMILAELALAAGRRVQTDPF